MTPITNNNAIAERLDRITEYWQEFAEMPDKQICRWLIKQDEYRMIDAFYEVESSEVGKTPDLFLGLETRYSSNYRADLFEELNQIIQLSREEGDDSEFADFPEKIKKWNPSPEKNIFENFEEFGQLMDDIRWLVIVFIAPDDLNNPSWRSWLENATRNLPPTIRIMFIDSVDSPQFSKFANKNSDRVHTIEPDLDMSSAIVEVAGMGNPKDPAVQFRQLYARLMQAGIEPDIPKAESIAERAIKLTEQNNWFLIGAAVHMALGGMYLNVKKNYRALTRYDFAIALCDKAMGQGDPAAEKQLVMALLTKAMGLFINKEIEEAAETYFIAGHHAVSCDDFFLVLESNRMSGHCYRKMGDSKKAHKCLTTAVEYGKKLDEATRKGSTLPFAAKELKEISNSEERRKLESEMREVLGKNWENLAKYETQKP